MNRALHLLTGLRSLAALAVERFGALESKSARFFEGVPGNGPGAQLQKAAIVTK
jgi:hypothetical protein